MKGIRPGSIVIMAEISGRQRSNELLVLNEENLGDKWNYAQIGFYSSEMYEIFILGVRGMGGSNDSVLAVDDVFFKDATYCNFIPQSAKAPVKWPLPTTDGQSTTTTKPTTNNDTSIDKDVFPYDCDFERDLCKWKQNDHLSFKKWIRIAANQTLYSRQPETDHTYDKFTFFFSF